eukprot:scaffold255347_cov48-Prasinocladus_malaysianus.AAC.2
MQRTASPSRLSTTRLGQICRQYSVMSLSNAFFVASPHIVSFLPNFIHRSGLAQWMADVVLIIACRGVNYNVDAISNELDGTLPAAWGSMTGLEAMLSFAFGLRISAVGSGGELFLVCQILGRKSNHRNTAGFLEQPGLSELDVRPNRRAVSPFSCQSDRVKAGKSLSAQIMPYQRSTLLTFKLSHSCEVSFRRLACLSQVPLPESAAGRAS